MTTPKPRHFQGWFYAPILIAILSTVAFLEPILSKRNFTYTASTFSSETSKEIPRNLTFALLDSNFKEVKQTKIILGKKFILHFWATWCAPCIEELPSLEWLNRSLSKMKSPPVKILAVSVDTKSELIKPLFTRIQLQPTFSILWDPASRLAQSIGTSKFPESYLIDADGKVLWKWVGPQDWGSEEVLNKLNLGNEFGTLKKP